MLYSLSTIKKMQLCSHCQLIKVIFPVGLCKIRFADIYGDHMVLQRAPRRAVLWGYADTIGDTVTVMKNGVLMGHTQVYRNITGIVKYSPGYSPVENKNDLELDFKVFFFTDSCCSDIVDDESK